MIIVFLLILRMMPSTHACLQTIPSTTPSPTGCCGEVIYLPTPRPNLPDGQYVPVYSGTPGCNTGVAITCSSFDTTLDLRAGIFGNQIYYLNGDVDTVTVEFTCQNGEWIYTDQGQSIAIDTVECVLTNLATEP
ncbi:C6 domain-containing protein [Caenorhabditis elegans]|uniref:C6 domain-containing protein n=1 Tax=Caenorhabditis elegans TaxID=6239 RepID=B2MZB6_CAEEL|nr:C6 domain-containing protein [Caenorhabditis elegans]CAQ48386.2 C6 domain-containing protein [Caenorhabditis elegans]|eukprot:NP_501538.4 Uncharacterized protein CELE_C09G9.3 [Caenorhabditis elegans]